MRRILRRHKTGRLVGLLRRRLVRLAAFRGPDLGRPVAHTDEHGRILSDPRTEREVISTGLFRLVRRGHSRRLWSRPFGKLRPALNRVRS